jgi:hypothetical protein
MQIVDNRALLLRLRNPSQVTTVIPKSKELADNQVLVNWDIEEAHVLRNLNIKAPSPIEGTVHTIRSSENYLRLSNT